MKLIGWLLRGWTTVLGATLRWRVEDPSGLLTRPLTEPVIFAFWHNRILLMPYLFRKHWRTRRRDRVAVLVSASRDGERLVQVLERFRLICVRGSTSRRGRQALVELTRLAQDGYDIGITPDGPRGPKYRVQDGVIQLACLTQAVIVPVAWDTEWKFVFRKAWDHFQVPWPFSKAVLRIGAPLIVPRDTDPSVRGKKRLELEQTLHILSDISL